MERGMGADAHELLGADLGERHAGIVVKNRNEIIRHDLHLWSRWDTEAISSRSRRRTRHTILAGGIDSQSPGWSFALHSLMQIRHNLVVPEKPFFRRGCCFLKTAHHFEGSENTGFFGMKWSRIGSALVVMTVSGIALAVLWPHAREAGAILAAQDDPAELSDIQLNSALRNNQAVIEQN